MCAKNCRNKQGDQIGHLSPIGLLSEAHNDFLKGVRVNKRLVFPQRPASALCFPRRASWRGAENGHVNLPLPRMKKPKEMMTLGFFLLEHFFPHLNKQFHCYDVGILTFQMRVLDV